MDKMSKIYLKRNTIMSITYEMLTIICGFILPKYILQYYGSETNGLVTSITQFLGFISLCELGMGAVVPASLYRPLADKDSKKINSIIISSQRFYRLIAIIMLVYIVFLIGIYPRMVKGSFSFIFTASLIGIISISTIAQYFFGITYSLLLKADQKQYISFFINSIALLANTVLSVVFIKLGFSIHVVKLLSTIIFLFRPIGLTLYVKHNYSINLNEEYHGEPIKQKWNGIAQHLANTIQEKADTVILTVLSTLSNVSIYGIYFMIINGMRCLVYSLTAGISALIGNMLAKNETDQLKETFEKFDWSMHTLTVLLFSVTGILIVPFVRVYTQGLRDSYIYIVPLFSTIMTIAIAARCIQMPYNVVIQAAGHFKETQTSAIIEPVINIAVSIIMVYKYGLVGVAVGTLISMTYRVIYLATYLMKHILYLKPIVFIKQLCVDVISAMVMVFTTFWMTYIPESYFQWGGYAIIVFTICLIECIVINFVLYRKFVIRQICQVKRKIEKKR